MSNTQRKLFEDNNVDTESPVKWKNIRDLANDAVALYSEKSIEGMRISDEHANKEVFSSKEVGYVNLMEDPTAPFKTKKLGEALEDDNKKYQVFEFVYEDVKDYEDYMNGTKGPVLVAQYLAKENTIKNSEKNPTWEDYRLIDLAGELDSDVSNIKNLIESRRDLTKRFWKWSKPYSSKKQVAAELYTLLGNIKQPDEDEKEDSCNGIVRFAFAGLNNNGNGNSRKDGAIGSEPAPWLRGSNEDSNTLTCAKNFLEGDPPEEDGGEADAFNPTLTYTGVKWDNNLHAETTEAEEYTEPPIGCCAEYTWPTIGEEWGGDTNVYNKYDILRFIDWADYRSKYRRAMSVEEATDCLVETFSSYRNLSDEDFDKQFNDGYFPAYEGEFLVSWVEGCDYLPERDFSPDILESYDHIRSLKSIHKQYQQWVSPTKGVYIRLIPMRFNAQKESKSSGVTKYAYLRVPVTVVVEIKPKSHQTAIRKRWYDMIYYTLRNIAGYKYRDMRPCEENEEGFYDDVTSSEPSEECASYKETLDIEDKNVKVIGVTWNVGARKEITKHLWKKLNPGSSENADEVSIIDPKCQCDRWKALELGNTPDNAHNPFVGTEDKYKELSAKREPDEEGRHYNAAQMWIWEGKITEDKEGMNDVLDYDSLFYEPYFELMLCAFEDDPPEKDKDMILNVPGGYVNDPRGALVFAICPLMSGFCAGTVRLPWRGGGNNEKCVEDAGEDKPAIDNNVTHAASINLLNKIGKYILDNKEPENITISCANTPMGSSRAQAVFVQSNMTFKFYDDNSYIRYGGDSCASVQDALKLTMPAAYQTPGIPTDHVRASGVAQRTQKETLTDSIKNEFRGMGYNLYCWKAFDPMLFQNGEYLHIGIQSIAGPADCATSFPRTNPYKAEPLDWDLNNTTKNYAYNEEFLSSCVKYSLYPDGDATNPIHDTWFSEADHWSKCIGIGGGTGIFSGVHDPIGICIRDNSEISSIGRIDVYIAPFLSEDGTLEAKHIGYYHVKRNNQETTSTCDSGDYRNYECKADGGKGEGVIYGELFNNVYQPYNIDYNIFTLDPEWSGTVTADKRPGSDFQDLNIDDVVKVNTMPIRIKDQRQKYIILAARASNVPLNSSLEKDSTVNVGGPNATPPWILNWATLNAGAVRISPFNVNITITNKK